MYTQSHTDLFGTTSGACFSPCGKYRYALWRIWEEALPKALCIGLNPSTADGLKDDPTIRLLKKLLQRLGYGGFYMVNLYAWISPSPKCLLNCEDPIGENDTVIEELVDHCEDIIFCWGNAVLDEERATTLIARFPRALCFGKTLAGNPIHPRYLNYQGRVEEVSLMKLWIE